MKQLFEVDARIAAIYPVAGIGDPDSPPEWVGALCDDFDAAEFAIIFARLPELATCTSGDVWPDKENVAEALLMAGRSGFFVKGEWCHRRYISETCFYSGWGIYRSAWFYVDDTATAFETVYAAAECDHEKARRKFASDRADADSFNPHGSGPVPIEPREGGEA